MTRRFWLRLAALCVLLIPECLAALYLAHSNLLPESDGAGYLIFGHRVYTYFRDGGLWQGLQALYTVRGFRPIIFDGFLLPFLLLTGGRIYPAYSLCILFITGYTTLYSFLLLKEKLSLLSASVGAALVVSLPSFLYLSVHFYPEISIPGLIIGAIYHLLKSHDFSRLRHVIGSAGLAVLALCIRPEQVLMMLAPVLLLAIGVAYRERLVAGKDVVLRGVSDDGHCGGRLLFEDRRRLSDCDHSDARALDSGHVRVGLEDPLGGLFPIGLYADGLYLAADVVLPVYLASV
jgi:hypothetical protein